MVDSPWVAAAKASTPAALLPLEEISTMPPMPPVQIRPRNMALPSLDCPGISPSSLSTLRMMGQTASRAGRLTIRVDRMVPVRQMASTSREGVLPT